MKCVAKIENFSTVHIMVAIMAAGSHHNCLKITSTPKKTRKKPVLLEIQPLKCFQIYFECLFYGGTNSGAFLEHWFLLYHTHVGLAMRNISEN